MADNAALEAMARQEQYNRQATRQVEELHMSQAKPMPPLPKQVKPLEFYRASDLYGKQLKRPPVIVEGMIPAGLTVLAGAPKRGKSWMALKLALCVSKGDKFLGFPTKRGSVLYLDLESITCISHTRQINLMVTCWNSSRAGCRRLRTRR